MATTAEQKDLLDRLAQFFHILGSPGRLDLLHALSEGPLSVSDLTHRTGMSQPLTSQHLRVLRDGGFVSNEREGRSQIYSLADQHIAHIVGDAVAHIEENWHD